MSDHIPPWVTEGIPDDPNDHIGPTFTPPAGASAVYDYTEADGFPAFKVVRFDAVNGHDKKRFQQFSLDGQQWVPRQVIAAGERPLFDLPTLNRYFGATVLIVEGEKTALAARHIIPSEWVVTTWAGGASAVKTADWSLLSQRDVVIWPDNDAPGLAAAKTIQTIIPQAHIIDVPLDFPEGWDLADPAPDGWTADDFAEFLGAPRKPKPVVVSDQLPTGFRPTIRPSEWQGQPIPVMDWIVPDLIPSGVVTMLSGDGGLGKSLLSLQLAVACATDEQWLGHKPKFCKVLIVACEDDPDELHRRLYEVTFAMQLGFEHLVDILIIPGAGHDNVLVDFSDFNDHGKRTEFCDFIQQTALEFGAQLVILDSLHDFFAGNENARPQARQFVNQLRSIAMTINGSVLLLAHPSVSGLTSDGRSGSTAWNNTVRSRLYLTRPKEEGARHLILKTVKANYSASGAEMRLEYRSGSFYNLDDKATSPVYEQLNAEDIFLVCLREATSQGRRVTESKSGSYAPKIFARMADVNRHFGVADFERAMERLFALGKIKVMPFKDASRNLRNGIVEIIAPKTEPFTDDEEI